MVLWPPGSRSMPSAMTSMGWLTTLNCISSWQKSNNRWSSFWKKWHRRSWFGLVAPGGKWSHLTCHNSAISCPKLKNYRRFLIYRKRSFGWVQPDFCSSIGLEMAAPQRWFTLEKMPAVTWPQMEYHNFAIFWWDLKNYMRFLNYGKKSSRRVQLGFSSSIRLEMTAHQSWFILAKIAATTKSPSIKTQSFFNEN